MRKPIHIVTRSDTTDASGGVTAVYTDVFGTVWTQDEQKKSISRDLAGKLVTATYHIYTVRYSDRIRSGMYISDPNYSAQYLYIQGTTDPDGQRHWLQLVAEDLNG
jgi:head-tail adaptor